MRNDVFGPPTRMVQRDHKSPDALGLFESEAIANRLAPTLRCSGHRPTDLSECTGAILFSQEDDVSRSRVHNQ